MLVGFILVMYLFLSMFSMSLSSVIMTLLLLESLSWMFSLILLKSSVIKYLMVQSVFFFVSILGLMWKVELLFLGVMIKIGLPPFHLWFMNLSQLFNKMTFLFFSTFHKMIPVFFVVKTVFSNFYFLTFFVLMGSTLLMMEMGSIFNLIIFSSLTHSGWMLLLSFMSQSMLLTYWFLYSTLMSLFFSGFYNINLLKMDENQNTYSSFMWLVICGLPPFTIFWLKVNIFYLLMEKIFLICIILIFASVLSLVVYYRVFHLSIFFSKSINIMSSFIFFMMLMAWV